MNNVRILLVEDEPLIREIVRTSLIDAGFEVVSVPSGETAIDLIERDVSRYAALVTDINLQRNAMSGWDVACAARDASPLMPVVYMTGAAAAEKHARGVANSLLLMKPFAPDQVVTAVQKLLDAVGFVPPPRNTSIDNGISL